MYVGTLRDRANRASSESVIAVDAVTGAERWSKTIEDDHEAHAAWMIYTNDMIYASTPGGMYTLDASSGAEQWRFDSSVCSKIWIESPPKISRGTIYFDNQPGYLYALNANTGVEEWKYRC